MNLKCRLIIVFLILNNLIGFSQSKKDSFFSADNKNFEYVGRIDFTNPKIPRFWNAGVYIMAKFTGTSCELLLNDQEQWGKDHNYFTVVIDDKKPVRLQTTGKSNSIKVAEGLSKGVHTITICKNTEAGIGYLEFVGLKCKALLPPDPKPARKIEFIGNSITGGTGADLSKIPCDEGQWYDQHNAYMSYGPISARSVNAQWHLTSVAGIGLIRSCCNMDLLMPQAFDKLDLREGKILWDFKRYIPDVVTICLGQNDGIQDSTVFTKAYIDFIKQIKTSYPNTYVVCLTSPMADQKLRTVLENYLTGIVDFLKAQGDQKVDKFFFSRGFNRGCGGHPDLEDHQLIAAELTVYLKKQMNW